jgi:hypothetical protein
VPFILDVDINAWKLMYDWRPGFRMSSVGRRRRRRRLYWVKCARRVPHL